MVKLSVSLGSVVVSVAVVVVSGSVVAVVVLSVISGSVVAVVNVSVTGGKTNWVTEMEVLVASFVTMLVTMTVEVIVPENVLSCVTVAVAR